MNNLKTILSALLIACRVSASEEILTSTHDKATIYIETARNLKNDAEQRLIATDMLHELGGDHVQDAISLYLYIAADPELDLNQRWTATRKLRELGEIFHKFAMNILFDIACKSNFSINDRFEALDKLIDLEDEFGILDFQLNISIAYSLIARDSTVDMDQRLIALDKLCRLREKYCFSYQTLIPQTLSAIASILPINTPKRDSIIRRLHELKKEDVIKGFHEQKTAFISDIFQDEDQYQPHMLNNI